MASGGLRLDFAVDLAATEEGIYAVLGQVRSGWNKEAIKFKSLDSFLSCNQNRLCYTTDDLSDGVVVRVCGGMRDTQQELAAAQLLHEVAAAPKLLCTFKNGLCYEYVHGENHTWTNLEPFKDLKRAKAVARELAKIHSKRTLELATKYGIKEHVVPFGVLHVLLQSWPSNTGNPEIDSMLSTHFPPPDVIQQEVGAMVQMITEQNIPIVFGHNDANPTNVIYNTGTDRATLVDFEVCGLSPQTYDLASFLESSAIGMFPDPDARRHNPDFQKAFLREYLESKGQLESGGSTVTENDVDKLYVQTTKTALMVYLISALAFVSIGARPMPSSTIPGKDLVGLGLTRFFWYQTHKEGIMAMKTG